MDQDLHPSETAATPGSEQQTGEYAVRAKCIIKLGDTCTVYFPEHCDHVTYMEHLTYHEQNAQVVKLHDGSVDIKMTSGPHAGEIVVNVNPMNLFFWGPFTSN